jgi:hypothetical protein
MRNLTMRLKKFTLACTAPMLLTATAAWADSIDFTCNLGPTEQCTGTITRSGSNYSTTGISIYNDSGPYSVTVPFTLSFDTSTGAISIDGTAVDPGENLVGHIISFSAANGNSTTDLSFTTVWPTLPPVVQTFLGTKTGVDSGFVITSSLVTTGGGSAASADIVIAPGTSIPEPDSLTLFGFGLLAIGEVLRRNLHRR